VNQYRENSEMMLGLFEDLEELLSTNEDFLLGKWLHDARSCGSSKKVDIV
jgi:Alpha-N-acetylglucosaminidase (NAGLU) C-terminal domain